MEMRRAVEREKMEHELLQVNHRLLAMMKACAAVLEAHPGWDREKIIQRFPPFADVLDDVLEEQEYVRTKNMCVAGGRSDGPYF